MTLAQKEHEESPVRKMQSLYFTSFHETVSSSTLMDKFYERAILASGVIDSIEKSDKPITIVDIAGGRGRIGDILKKLLEKRGISKRFNCVVVDISKEELGKERGKHKIVGDITQVPLANKTADVVFLVNMPNPTSAIRIHMLKKTPGVNKGSGEDSRVYSLIDNVGTAMFLLNIGEGVRVLKENGVMVGGTRYGGRRTDFGGLAPLEADKFEVFKLDKGVKKLWKDYGLDLYGSEFFVETFIKKGEVKRKVIDEYEAIMKYNSEELSKNSRFWEIAEEMRAEQSVKEGVQTSAGIVKLREETGMRNVGNFYDVILKPSDSPEERKIGTVYVILRKVEEISLQPRSILMKEGLRGDDSIAEIFGFTPFWELTKSLAPDAEEHIKEKFMRKKIGTATMKLLLDELKSGEVIGAYYRTDLEEMRGLLKKFEFQEICEAAHFKKF